MKKKIFFIVLLSTLYTINLYTQEWEPLGPNDFDGETGFSSGYSHNINLAIDVFGTPYVAYIDYENEHKASVKKFDGNSWIPVGATNITIGSVKEISLAIDASGILYIAYRDDMNYGKTKVKKFDGNSWVNVGAESISIGLAHDISLVIDPHGILYIAYLDHGNKNQATVKKFDGNSWTDTGTIGFCEYLSRVWAPSITLTFNSKGIPYVGYTDITKDNKVTAKKYIENSWEIVGKPGFSDEPIPYDIFITTDAFDTPYMLITGSSFNTHSYLKKFNGNYWEDINIDGIYSGISSVNAFALDHNATPYIAYRDIDNQAKVTVKKLDGNNWISVGLEGFSKSQISNPKLAIDKSGDLIIVYSSDYFYAKKFNTTLGVDSFADTRILLYPNPVKDNLNIDVGDDLNNYSIEIFDMLGRNVYKNSTHKRIKSINLEGLTTGVYNIRLTNNRKQISKKIIKL